MNINFNKILEFFSTKKVKQITYLFSVNILGIPLGMITSIYLTKILGAKSYGDYMFINNLFNLTIIMATFGFFHAGNRAIIESKSKDQVKEYYGAELIYTFAIFILVSLIIIVFANYDSNLNSKGLKMVVLYLLPFSWVYILVKYIEVLFQADNKIELLSKARLYPKFLFLVLLLIFFWLIKFDNNKLLLSFYVLFLSQISIFFLLILKLNVSFKNFKLRFIEIWNYNKSFGFHIYIGSIFGVAFAQLSIILISYFGIDNSGVGFYSLALTIAAPLSLIPNTIATVYYKDFSSSKNISPKAFYFTLVVTIFTLFLSWLLIKPFITYFYGFEFESVINLFYVVSVGAVFHGIADFYNRFLGAHGQGKLLRNSSIIVGTSLLVSNIILIPLLKEEGAAITKFISGLIYFFIIRLYYKKFKITSLK